MRRMCNVDCRPIDTDEHNCLNRTELELLIRILK